MCDGLLGQGHFGHFKILILAGKKKKKERKISDLKNCMLIKRTFHKHLCRLSDMENDFRNLRAKVGQIWIIQSRARIFQGFG